MESNTAELERLVKEHDIVISLLPYSLHPLVARMCIKHRTNMVTTSYLSQEMASLNQNALDAQITIMNEAGLDPGIDHMLAMECIDGIHEKGGKVRSFISYCGGLPAPEFSETPLRYKFSWNPKGSVMALLNPAKYLKNGELVEIAAGGGVLGATERVNFMPGFNLIGYPNRDSTTYAPLYGIKNEVKTILRGTLRYQGFIEAFRALHALGLTAHDQLPILDPNRGPEVTWKQLVAHLMQVKEDIFEDSLKNLVAEKFGPASAEYKTVNDLGLLSDSILVERSGTPLDTLAAFLSKNLAYKPGERDLVVLRHDVTVQWPAGRQETQQVNLVQYGNPQGSSAMASTVGYTAAIVAHMIMTGEIQRKGMVLPLTRDIYRPVLKRLETLGIASYMDTVQESFDV